MGEADRCREGRVRRCDFVISATVGSGWLSWFYFRFYFLLEQRERNRADGQAWLGGASGWLGVARDDKEQRAESEQRVRREIGK